MRRASKRNFGLMAIITVMIIASIVGVNALADMVGVGNVVWQWPSLKVPILSIAILVVVLSEVA